MTNTNTDACRILRTFAIACAGTWSTITLQFTDYGTRAMIITEGTLRESPLSPAADATGTHFRHIEESEIGAL